jgi:dTDP-4-dehydrorhamnose reductase
MPGSHLCRLSGERHGIVASDVEEMDVRDHARAFETMSKENLGVAVHVSGMIDGNGCDSNAGLVHSVNALGTKSAAPADH